MKGRKTGLISAVHALEQSAKGVTAKFEKFSTNAATCGNGVVVNGLLANGHGPAQTTATRSDNDLVVHASYVVGCDGANSTVRCLQKFTMTDLGFENQWLIADLVSAH